MSRIGKTALTEIVAERTGLPANTVQCVIGEVFDAITRELAKGNAVSMRGFGTWRTKVLAPRQGRDPRTGEQIGIRARTRIDFNPGTSLRESAESSIESEVFLGDGVAPTTAIESVLNNVLDDKSKGRILQQVRRCVRSLHGPAADREAHEFFSELGEPLVKGIETGAEQRIAS
ncbi:MAG: nucleoid DNA-binding protein [Planctomycetota bacterium]|jgi:nucleoid DNA-binding protein